MEERGRGEGEVGKRYEYEGRITRVILQYIGGRYSSLQAAAGRKVQERVMRSVCRWNL